jgi:hypothetical protein
MWLYSNCISPCLSVSSLILVKSGTAWRGKSVLDLVFFFLPACSLSSKMGFGDGVWGE